MNDLLIKTTALAALCSAAFTLQADGIDMRKGTDAFVALSDCLDTVPNSDITNPAHLESKNLTLTTAVIENINVELGTQVEQQEEFKALSELANKYCEKQIKDIKTLVSASNKG